MQSQLQSVKCPRGCWWGRASRVLLLSWFLRCSWLSLNSLLFAHARIKEEQNFLFCSSWPENLEQFFFNVNVFSPRLTWISNSNKAEERVDETHKNWQPQVILRIFPIWRQVDLQDVRSKTISDMQINQELLEVGQRTRGESSCTYVWILSCRMLTRCDDWFISLLWTEILMWYVWVIIGRIDVIGRFHIVMRVLLQRLLNRLVITNVVLIRSFYVPGKEENKWSQPFIQKLSNARVFTKFCWVSRQR